MTHGNSGKSTWSASQDETLQAEWGILRCRQIANLIGKSKNAVVGRARRLGLERLSTRPKEVAMPKTVRSRGAGNNPYGNKGLPKPKPGLLSPAGRSAFRPPGQEQKEAAGAPLAPWQVADAKAWLPLKSSRPAPLLDLAPDGCRWPVFAEDGPRLFCNAPAGGQTWCAHHERRGRA